MMKRSIVLAEHPIEKSDPRCVHLEIECSEAHCTQSVTITETVEEAERMKKVPNLEIKCAQHKSDLTAACLLQGPNMKVCSTAVLALVGWYLMMPPIYSLNQTQAEWEASIDKPIGQWQRFKSFDTAAECEAELTNLRSQAMGKGKGPVPMSLRQLVVGECIATDDPRLKAN